MLTAAKPVLEHHRSFIPSTLVSQLEEEKTKAAAKNQTQNSGPPALATGALTTELQLPTSTQAFNSSFKGDRQPHTQTDAQGVYEHHGTIDPSLHFISVYMYVHVYHT